MSSYTSKCSRCIYIFILLASFLLSFSLSFLTFDCDANGLKDALSCQNYMQITLQAYTGNGQSSTVAQEYSSVQFPYNLTGDLANVKTIQVNPAIVYFELFILGVLSLDEVEGSMSLNVLYGMSWTDSRLRWNISETLGVDFMVVNPSWIYVPDIVLQNSVGSFASGLTQNVATIYSTGIVSLVLPGSITATCDVNLEMFPFDIQNCSFVFFSNSQSESTLALKIIQSPNLNFPGTVSWESLGASMEKIKAFSSGGFTEGIKYYVAIKRYPKTYTSTCIMPNAVVSAIAVLSLYTSDHMARIGVALTALLTVIAVMVRIYHFNYYLIA